jgi:hypothetical protein
MFWFFLIALWAAMLLSPLLLLFMFLPSGRDCPRCSGETLPIVSRMLRPVRRITQLRWCSACGWQGVMRHTRVGSPLPKFEVVPDDGGEEQDDGSWKDGTASY